MPDFGLTEALQNAMKTISASKNFVRAPEAMSEVAPALRPKTTPADAVAQAVSRRESALAPTPGTNEAPAASVPAAPGQPPRVDPTPAPADPTAPSPEAAAQVPEVPPADPATPPTLPGTTTDPVNDPTAPPKGVAPPDDAVPSAQPGDRTPGQSPVDAAAAPPSPSGPEVKNPDEATVLSSAQKFVSANMEGFEGKLDMTHMPNVDTLDVPGAWKASLLQMADDNKGAIEESRRGTIGREQLFGLAEDYALNTDVVSTVLNRAVGTQFERPEILLAAHMQGVNVLGEVAAAYGPILDGAATSAEVTNAARAEQLFIKYWTQYQGGVAEQGRGTGALAYKVPGSLPPEAMDHIAGILKNNNLDMVAKATAIKLAQTPVGIANILSGSLAARSAKAAGSLVLRTFINGILSGTTWARIFVGNSFNIAMNTADIANAGLIRGAIGLAGRLGHFPTSAEGAHIADAFTAIHGMIDAGNDAFRLAGRTLKTGVSLDGILRYDPSEIGGLKNVNPALGTTQSVVPEIQGTMWGSLAKGIDKFIDFPGSHVVGSVDELGKTLGARGYRTMMTMREIRNQLLDGTLKPGDAGAIARQMFENPSTEMLQAEEDYAHRMTFQTPFPDGGFGQGFSNLIAEKQPAIKFILPFMRTTTNIFKQSVGERTPLALFSQRVRNQIAAGGFERDMALSRLASGTAMISAYAWAAIHDQITDDGPKDPIERGRWLADGRLPNSVKITDPITGAVKWHPYGWFEPAATVASIVANIARTWTQVHQLEEVDSLKSHSEMLGEVIANVAASVITNTADKTTMTNAAKFSEVIADPKHAFSGWATDFGTSLVPYSKAIEWTRNLSDPYLRTATTLLEKIQNDLPTVRVGGHTLIEGSKGLGVATDLFGNPRTQLSPLGSMSPFPGHADGEDDVTDELAAVMSSTGKVPIKMPSRQISMPTGGLGKDIMGGSGMPLTSMEYSELVQKSRAEKNFDGGTLNLHDKIAQTIKGPTYQGSTPAERADQIENLAITADKIGRNRLVFENDEVRARLMKTTADANRIATQQ